MFLHRDPQWGIALPDNPHNVNIQPLAVCAAFVQALARALSQYGLSIRSAVLFEALFLVFNILSINIPDRRLACQILHARAGHS